MDSDTVLVLYISNVLYVRTYVCVIIQTYEKLKTVGEYFLCEP